MPVHEAGDEEVGGCEVLIEIALVRRLKAVAWSCHLTYGKARRRGHPLPSNGAWERQRSLAFPDLTATSIK